MRLFPSNRKENYRYYRGRVYDFFSVWWKETSDTVWKMLQIVGKTMYKVWHPIDRFFTRSPVQRERIHNLIEQGLDIDLLYRLQLLSSVVIATFGLLTNSIPVIIGAMLIAPLLQPIQGVSYAVATGNMKMYIKSFKYIAISIGVALAGAGLLSFVVPFRELTPEILARATPTILDLGIAFASGIIAFLVLGFKKLSGTMVGAAIAASLLPPLCATGVGLVFLNWQVIRGTFLLFTANLVSIIVAGVLFFYLYGFNARGKTGEFRQKKQLLITAVTLLIVAIPLYTSMTRITQDRKIKNTITTSLETTLPTISPQIELVSFDQTRNVDNYSISLQLKVPESMKITTQDKNIISQHLASQLQSPVEVGIEALPITSVYVPKEITPTLSEQIHTSLVSYINKKYQGVYILNFTYQEASNRRFVVLQIYSEHPIDKTLLRKDILQYLETTFNQSSTDFNTGSIQENKKEFYVYINGQIKEKVYTEKGNALEQELLDHMIVLFPHSNVQKLSVKVENDKGNTKKYLLTINFMTVRDPYRTKKILSKRKKLLEKTLGVSVDLIAKVSYVEEIRE